MYNKKYYSYSYNYIIYYIILLLLLLLLLLLSHDLPVETTASKLGIEPLLEMCEFFINCHAFLKHGFILTIGNHQKINLNHPLIIKKAFSLSNTVTLFMYLFIYIITF